MSDGDEDLHIQLMLTEPRIAKLTAPAMGEALDDFRLTPQRDMTWIARAVQGALYCTLANASDGPERQANVETRKELERLAKRASDLWRDLFEMSGAADTALWDLAFRGWDGEGGFEIDGSTIGEPSDYRAFKNGVASLDWLAVFLKDAAKAQEPQTAKWRQAERREERIKRAHFLSPIFEAAYAAEATVITWPGNDGGPWPDFYQRIVGLAFGERATPDREGVLDEARRRHKAHRVTFAPGIIPD